MPVARHPERAQAAEPPRNLPVAAEEAAVSAPGGDDAVRPVDEARKPLIVLGPNRVGSSAQGAG